MEKEKTPSEKLADTIFEKLLEKNLVSEDGKADFIRKLSQGRIRESNWKVTLEQPIKSPSNPPNHETPKA